MKVVLHVMIFSGPSGSVTGVCVVFASSILNCISGGVEGCTFCCLEVDACDMVPDKLITFYVHIFKQK